MKEMYSKKNVDLAHQLAEYGWRWEGNTEILFSFEKSLKDVTKNMTTGIIRADIDIAEKCVRFIPCNKMKYDYLDIRAMFFCANQFMKIAKEYGCEWVEVWE